MDSPEDDDQQNAELHDRKGPEFDGAEGNGGDDDQRNEDEFDEIVDHSSKLKVQSSKENIKKLKAQC